MAGRGAFRGDVISDVVIAEFAQHFNKPPDQLGAEETCAYQLFLLNEKRVKRSSYIQAI